MKFKIQRESNLYRPMFCEGKQLHHIYFFDKVTGEILAHIARSWIEDYGQSMDKKGKLSYTGLISRDILAFDFLTDVRRALKVEPNIKKGGSFYVPVAGDRYCQYKQCDLYIDIADTAGAFETLGEKLNMATDEEKHYRNFYAFTAEVTELEPYLDDEGELQHRETTKERRVLFAEACYSRTEKTDHGNKIAKLEEFMKDVGFTDMYHCKEMYERSDELRKLLK